MAAWMCRRYATADYIGTAAWVEGDISGCGARRLGFSAALDSAMTSFPPHHLARVDRREDGHGPIAKRGTKVKIGKNFGICFRIVCWNMHVLCKRHAFASYDQVLAAIISLIRSRCF
jgi:hypothetical protein